MTQPALEPNTHRVAITWQAAGDAAAAVLDAKAAHVWLVSIDAAQPPALREARCKLLSAGERERARRFRFEKHRTQFILCRGALRVILGQYLRRAPGDIVFACEKHGKPVLAKALELESPAAEALQFNVSHSGAFALVAVARGLRIGVDIERVRRLDDADAIAKRFFSRAEYRKYVALPEEARPEGFYNCWTRKEAFIKAIGEGLSRPLNTFEVSLRPDEPPRLIRIDGHPGEEALWSLDSFEPAPGYAAALARECPGGRVAFYGFEA